MRSSVVLLAIVGSMLLWSCQNSAIVVWERDGTLHGRALTVSGQYDGPRPLPLATITTFPELFTATSQSNGDWTASLTTLSVPITLWYACSGHDTATSILWEWSAGRSTQVRDVALATTVVDTVLAFDIDVDSVTTDSIWCRVRANVPNSAPYITVCFYDTLESVDATVKKWSDTFNTYVLVSRAECDGRRISRSINSYLSDLLHRLPLFATCAIGVPYSNFVYNHATQAEELFSVSGLGPLNSWVPVAIP